MSRWTVPYHHGDLPAALLDAVAAAVAEHGVTGVSLRDVARRAGVSHGAPAHHFGSKAGMLTAFATRGYQLLASFVLAEVTAAAADGGGQAGGGGRRAAAVRLSSPPSAGDTCGSR